jgi:hypothetical protein
MPDASSFPEMAALRSWFASWCESFRSPDQTLQRNFDLKELHTRNVIKAAQLIAEGGGERRSMLAEVAALCHDLGRFPQFRDYGTFKDSDSVNHAHLSAKIITEHRLLDFLPDEERNCVSLAVRLHNVFQVPAGLAPLAAEMLRLVRDADKLDIWRVFIEYFEAPEEERASAAGLGAPDLPFCSADVLETIRTGELVQLSQLKSLNDFKLLQLSWLYDINFPTTFRLIKERDLLARLGSTLPADPAVREVMSRLQDYLERRVEG